MHGSRPENRDAPHAHLQQRGSTTSYRKKIRRVSVNACHHESLNGAQHSLRRRNDTPYEYSVCQCRVTPVGAATAPRPVYIRISNISGRISLPRITRGLRRFKKVHYRGHIAGKSASYWVEIISR